MRNRVSLPRAHLPQPRCLLHPGPPSRDERETKAHGICAESRCRQQQRATPRSSPSSSPHLLVYQRVLILLLLLLLPQRQRHILLFPTNAALCRARPPRTKRENRMRALCLAPRRAGADRRRRIRGQ
jgi:hypothetical protein